MANKTFLFPVILGTLLTSCSGGHLIDDKSHRDIVVNDFETRKSHIPSLPGDIFSLTESVSDIRLQEALMFLAAYMPLNDIADCNPEFIMAGAQQALRSKEEMPWGDDIPYDIFLHFVLPLRVNNENLDSFRIACYDEIRERVKGMDAQQAALEINHWCHEKVTYQPSDSRTSAPLSTILSARGRCGEESTFTVTALRTAGLPARQVYTPRWAHSDDNHAWVEVWINGSWYYMGACEPEPVLDRGWFTEPAGRAMLIHTKAFGRYLGNEPLVKSNDLYSEINVLPKYAVTKDLTVNVVDEDNLPVRGADIDFLLYNYAELYPIASLKSNENGEAVFTTGKGSLVVWASLGQKSGFTEALPDSHSVKVKISATRPSGSFMLDLVAPPVPEPSGSPSEELIKANSLRLKSEDSIRQAYIDTWMKDTDTEQLAAKTGIDRTRLEKTLKLSMGNYRTVVSVLSHSGDKADIAIRLLESISDKDLRDTKALVLLDHINNLPVNRSGYDNDFYDRYIMSPRVDNEILTPFRGKLLSSFPDEVSSSFASDPAFIAQWVDTAITITVSDNYYGTPVTPPGTAKMRLVDSHSRDIFFVALCRTFGHPSRFESGTDRPQYFKDGKWVDVWFRGSLKPSPEKCYVTFSTTESNPAPEYHIHFTLARYEEGKYRTLDFGYNSSIKDMSSYIALDPGSFMLLTGNRDENGNVLSEVQFFELQPGSHNNIDVRLRHKNEKTAKGSTIPLDKKFMTTDNKEISLSALSDKGVVLCWIDPDKEPTKHVLRDLPQYAGEFNKWGGYFIFLLEPSTATRSFKPSEAEGLPANSLFAWDEGFAYLKEVSGDAAGASYPVIMVVNSEGETLFSSEGYRIGVGEMILKNLK